MFLTTKEGEDSGKLKIGLSSSLPKKKEKKKGRKFVRKRKNEGVGHSRYHLGKRRKKKTTTHHAERKRRKEKGILFGKKKKTTVFPPPPPENLRGRGRSFEGEEGKKRRAIENRPLPFQIVTAGKEGRETMEKKRLLDLLS